MNGLVTVEACSSLPSKATRVRRRIVKGADVPEVKLDRRQICESMIQSGNVQSFVDFFYLTHRPEVSPEEDLDFIGDRLTRAESARRKGDTETVCSSFTELASYFRVGDPKTCVYFSEKCLEITKLAGDFRGEMKANLALGRARRIVGDYEGATTFHERHLEMARALEDRGETKLALSELVDAYRNAAENGHQPIRFYRACLEAAQSAGDEGSQARAALELGRSTQIGRKEAEKFLHVAENLFKLLDDTRGEGEACAALAEVVDDDDRALEYLERYSEIANGTEDEEEDLVAQADASRRLGELRLKQKEYELAADLFRQSFIVTKRLFGRGRATTAMLEKARVLLGVALGNAAKQKYLRALDHDFAALLAWKNSRTPLPSSHQLAS